MALPQGPDQIASGRNPRLLMQVALGRQAADLVLSNCNLVNVYTAETEPDRIIAIKDGWIAYCGPADQSILSRAHRQIDLDGKTVIPGLIDGHTHMAWLFEVATFVEGVMAHGATTIITETLEPYPVCGLEGVLDFLDALADQPIKLFASAPAMVSISPGCRGIDPSHLEYLLGRPDVLAIGESYWQGVIQEPDRFAPLLAAAARAGKLVEGHSAGAAGSKLQAYAACGVTSCHEPISAEEAAERMRLGIHVMAREGSIRRDVAELVKLKDLGIDLRRFIIATDGISPQDLSLKGYLDHSLNKAIQAGLEPIRAIQAATLNVAEHFHLDHLVGGIAPGRCADLVVIPAADRIQPLMVLSNGQLVAENGRPLVKARAHAWRPENLDSINLERKFSAADFMITATGASARVRAISMVTDLVTKQKILQVPVKHGQIVPDPAAGLLKVAAVDRRKGPGSCFTGLITGFGLKQGAMASSAAWDTSDIIVVGADDKDMALAINRINELHGGTVVCCQGKSIAELALPLFGLCSRLSLGQLAASASEVNRAAADLGVPFADPMLSLVTLTGAAIPFLRICEQGLVDLKKGVIKELIIDPIQPKAHKRFAKEEN